MRLLLGLFLSCSCIWGGVHAVHAMQPAPKPLETGPITLPAGPVILNVWSALCDACQQEAPDVAKYEASRPAVPVVGVSAEDTSDETHAFIAKYGLQRQNEYWDGGGGYTWYTLKVHAYPTTIVLDRHHHQVERFEGAATLDQLNGWAREASK